MDSRSLHIEGGIVGVADNSYFHYQLFWESYLTHLLKFYDNMGGGKQHLQRHTMAPMCMKLGMTEWMTL